MQGVWYQSLFPLPKCEFDETAETAHTQESDGRAFSWLICSLLPWQHQHAPMRRHHQSTKNCWRCIFPAQCQGSRTHKQHLARLERKKSQDGVAQLQLLHCAIMHCQEKAALEECLIERECAVTQEHAFFASFLLKNIRCCWYYHFCFSLSNAESWKVDEWVRSTIAG